jgi:hypothetical protein
MMKRVGWDMSQHNEAERMKLQARMGTLDGRP